MTQFIIKKGKLFCLMVVSAMTIFLCSCGQNIPDYVAASATVEAGKAFRAADFILEAGHTAEFADDFAKKYAEDGVAKINQLGQHSVSLVVDGKKYTIDLTVKDTVAPTALPNTITVCPEDTVTASQCVTNIQDQTTVICSFETEPDLSKSGLVNAMVILTDEGGNSNSVPVLITVLAEGEVLANSYFIEAGAGVPSIETLTCSHHSGKFITDVSVINTSLVGSYNLELKIDGTTCTTKLIIKDTVAPTATVVPVTLYFGGAFPPAESFVTNIVDAGPVTVTYATNPGKTVGDDAKVRVVLTDQSGNRTTYDGECTVARDDEAPTFVSFPEELEAEINTSIVWRALVEAKDDSGTVELSLDTSDVNLKKAGTYTAYFVAKDPAGNETRQKVKLILHDMIVTKEMMDQVCEEITREIISNSMTTQEKLFAVYQYVLNNIKYTSDSPHDDIRREAYLSLTSRKSGDCYAFFAASYELIAYLGYDTQMVRRDIELVNAGYGNHFWVLVNCGTDENPLWYHHDASPHSKPYDLETYMMTDAQVKAYTNYRASTSSKKHYYTYDTSLHPASATEETVDLGIDSIYYE